MIFGSNNLVTLITHLKNFPRNAREVSNSGSGVVGLLPLALIIKSAIILAPSSQSPVISLSFVIPNFANIASKRSLVFSNKAGRDNSENVMDLEGMNSGDVDGMNSGDADSSGVESGVRGNIVVAVVKEDKKTIRHTQIKKILIESCFILAGV